MTRQPDRDEVLVIDEVEAETAFDAPSPRPSSPRPSNDAAATGSSAPLEFPHDAPSGPAGWAGDESDVSLGEELLAAARLDVAQLLEQMPEALLEAKKFIAARMWPSPRPEELQAIARIAAERNLAPACSQAVTTLLALRLSAEREARSFWDELPLDPDEIRLRASRMSGVAACLAAFGDPSSLTWGAGRGLDSDSRELLAKVARVLLPRPDRLLAARVLAPRLSVLLEKTADEMKEVVPAVTREETRILASPLEGIDELAIDLKRTCLHVAAARWLMHDDLFEWDALSPAEQDDPDSPCVVNSGEADSDGETAESGQAAATAGFGGPPIELDGVRRAKLAETLHRLREDEHAYRAVSAQLQSLQDRTLKAHRKDLTDLLIRLRRPLLAAYTRLAVILRSPAAAELASGDSGTSPRKDPVQKAVAAEAEADAEQVETVYEQAVSSLKAKPRLLERLTPALRSRRRMIALVSTLVVVAVGAPIVFLNLPPAPPPPLTFAPSDSINVKLSYAAPIGTMLYAEVDDYWGRLSPDQRREKLDDLARLATEKGFQSLLLTERGGEVVGRWEISTGSTVVEPASMMTPAN